MRDYYVLQLLFAATVCASFIHHQFVGSIFALVFLPLVFFAFACALIYFIEP